ncbi:MAG: hypothetical protein LC655_01815 [Bacteroidales bacterium]|nr:hypothetical protein [Bacteroidales bacterium]
MQAWDWNLINDIRTVRPPSNLHAAPLCGAIQEGMFGEQASGLIAFVFAMPFLVHPLVFGIFGKTAENNGVTPVKLVYALAFIGVLGVSYALFF